ncbi:membrane protein [Flavihumibacter solisilvae]|uniref:Membrane protein n=2 Tax=Flavihumibacter solisilvae TaxID=1349421 RepID=A0A0C1KY92_9BACT|nr:membrane protein [Flavihumibacter solisilvae]
MMPEIILLSVFFLTLIITKLRSKEYKFAFSGRVAMAAMLVTTGLAHFAFAKGMAMMLPDFIPFRMMVVYITGILELLAAVGLLLPRYVKLTGRLLIIFFVLLLPANIYAAINHVNLQTATYDGDGPGYLWFRIPLQAFFIGWVYLSSIKPSIVIWKLSA